MKILVAGATGAVGKQLVPMLVEKGHEVAGITRSPGKADLVRGMGAEPLVADALDPDAVGRAVSESQPDVIVHQLTAIPENLNIRRFDRDFALTNRLRTEGTDHLLSAGRAAGVRRFVAQSFAGPSLFARTDGMVKTEDDPIDPDPPEAFRSTIEAIRYMEDAVTGADWVEGIVLRYAGFYGPGTSIAPGGAQVEAIRKRQFPVVGDGGGVWSLIHIEDAASATVAAIEHGRPGIYQVADDEPARVRDLLPVLAAAVGAKPPRRVPKWLGRLLAGEGAVVMMTAGRGASNAKAKRELGWTPRYPSWRQGFADGLG